MKLFLIHTLVFKLGRVAKLEVFKIHISYGLEPIYTTMGRNNLHHERVGL